MYVNQDARAIYVAHPRTASRSTADALWGAGFTRRFKHHGRVSDEFPRLDVDTDPEEWSVATTVRNHFDALVSWRLRKGEDLEFTETWLRGFVGNEDFVRHHRLYWRHIEAATRVMRFETLQTDLNDWLHALGLSEVELTRQGQTRPTDEHYSNYYGERERLFVEAFFFDELRRLSYSFKEG